MLSTVLCAKHPSMNRQEDGFTLVEILVVIIIIGILAAVAIPIFLNQRRAAQDSALTTDLRNTAGQVAFLIGQEGAREDLQKNTASRTVLQARIAGKDSVAGPGGRSWNDLVASNDFPEVVVSDGSLVEVAIIFSSGNDWTAHEPGEFCLSGTNQYSSYNFVPGAGQSRADYDKYLFYDVKAGGIKTMDELVEAVGNGQEVSCTGFVNRYIAATSK